MTTLIKTLLGILVVALIGLGIFLYTGSRDTDAYVDPTGTPSIPAPTSQALEPAKPQSAAGTAGTSDVEATDLTRREVQTIADDRADSAQGVRGTVVGEFGEAVPDAEVYLMPGIGKDAIRMHTRFQQGVRFPPVAATRTGPDGKFQLGVKEWQEGSTYQITVLHPDYCDHKIPDFQPQPNDWYDAEKIELEKGAAIFGQVTDEAGAAIAAATVTVRDGTGLLNLAPVPGREDGIVATTDGGGGYQIQNLDAKTIYTITVSAEGYAKESKAAVQLDPQATGGRQQFDFRLVPGLDIGGMVANPKGEPIRGARLTVASMSTVAPQVETVTADDRGLFLARGLREGAYVIAAEADGYQRAEEKPIQTGRTDVAIVMEKQGSVIVTVLDKRGRPLPAYECHLRPMFKEHSDFGNRVLSRTVTGARDGKVVIDGINPMNYVVEVMAAEHAKNYSAPFTIEESTQKPPEVTVRLDEGGSLAGVVTDEKGAPIAGATVSTRPDKWISNPFVEMFAISYKITKQDTKTDGQGRFQFDLLHPGAYQLEFEHHAYCKAVRNGSNVAVGEVTTLPNVELTKGCLVSGIARYDGKAMGQIQVHVNAVADQENPMPTNCKAVTDNAGAFLIEKRLPPGRYEVMAAAPTPGGPLLGLLLMQKSKKTFSIAAGQEHFELSIDLPKIDQ